MQTVMPSVESNPLVGLIPTTPLAEAGTRMDALVSVPTHIGAKEAAAATALPPDEPYEDLDRSKALLTRPKSLMEY